MTRRLLGATALSVLMAGSALAADAVKGDAALLVRTAVDERPHHLLQLTRVNGTVGIRLDEANDAAHRLGA